MRRNDLIDMHENLKVSGAKILAAGQPCKIGECNQNNLARSPDGAQRNPGRSHTRIIRPPDCAEPVIGRAFARPVGSIRATRDVAYRFALACSAELCAASASLAEIAAVSA